ncbi:hypothetical protein CXB51_005471 [Gossypium anomalum]|uniref:DUF7745 domain-containing protein n=1 Tax=Gossypium anomalum TaxID=47600 RepID=A0A8J5ZHX0_9ROSI|nr:hypothetical protein CXB51_005471 [Gossypium anomalum]
MTVVVTPLSGSEKLHLREVFTSVQDSGSLSGYIRIDSRSVSKLGSFVMENGLLDRVEGNANVHRWFEQTQLEKGDSISVGSMSELPDYTRISVDEHLFRALAQFWNPVYSCFTFGEIDLVPTVEEYTALLRCPSESRLELKKKGFGICGRGDHGSFSSIIKRVTSIPAILAETFRSLGACRRAGAGRFIGCAQLLLAWFYSHSRLVDRVVCRVFFEDYSPLKDIVASIKRVDVPEENWIALLQNLQSKDIEWRAPWMIPATHGLAQSEFVHKGADYKKRVSEISSAWNKTCRLKGVAISPATTPEYVEWRGRRINDNIPKSNVEGARLIEEYLRVMPSELETMKQEFERRNMELEKRIVKLEEEKMYLSLDVNVQKMEVEKERKEKRKIEEDRNDLKEHYKKAQVSLKRARVGGSSDQLQKEVQEGKARAEYWEKKF